jgi:hypothetical protein
MFIRRGSAILRSPDPDPAGGGGGGDPAVPFTPEQLTALGTIVNGAFKDQLKRSLGPGITEALKATKWDEVLAAPVKTLLEQQAPPPPPGGDPAQPAKPDPKIAALESKLAALETKAREDADKLAKAQSEARDKDTMSALRTALTPHVRPEVLDLAVRDLFVSQRRVSYDEQGNPLFTVKRSAYAGAAEEDTPMPLADGAQHWLKSPEAKFFMPAAGGGAPPPGGGAPRRPAAGDNGLPAYDKPATTDHEKIRRADEQAAVLAAKYPHLANR